MSWDDDVTCPEPREPQDSWAGGAGEEPDDLDRRVYRLDPARPHPADCACSVHGEPRPLSCACHGGCLIDEACTGCLESLRQRDAETEATPGAIPAREMDDITTAHQCVICGRAERDCKCKPPENF